MYKKFPLIFLIFIYSCSSPKPELVLSVYTYDFGILETDQLYSGSLTIQNTGDAVLEIQGADPDCGCTNVSLTKKVLSPDDTCLLRFTYNTHLKYGKYENYICITANTDSVVHVLQINSFVK